jgi:hypothetical protein
MSIMTKAVVGILLGGLLAASTLAIQPGASFAQDQKIPDKVSTAENTSQPAPAVHAAAKTDAADASSDTTAKRPRTAYQDKLKACGAKWKDEKKTTGAKGRDAWNAFRKDCMKG